MVVLAESFGFVMLSTVFPRQKRVSRSAPTGFRQAPARGFGAVNGSGVKVVHTAYNAVGEAAWTKDQNGTVIKTVFDLGGRISQKQATTIGSGVDDWVERIALAYTNRGQTETVIQYDDPTGGTALNGIKYTYDDWGNVTQLDQDFDSAVVGSGNEKSVAWSYSREAPHQWSFELSPHRHDPRRWQGCHI